MFHHRQGVTSRSVDDEMVLVGPGGTRVHQLNRTASFVWSRCDGSHTVDDIVDAMVREFDVEPGFARTETDRLIGELQKLELVMSTA